MQNATIYGASTSLVIGKSTGTFAKRTIIKFNLAGIPSNATVLNAQMKLRYYGISGTPWIDRWVQAHQLLRHWREGEADSLKRRNGSNWLAPRSKIGPGSDSTLVDANGQYESTALFQNGEYPVWKSWDLTALTQKWLNGSATNYGVILWAYNEENGMNLWFRSSEYSDPTYRPLLEIIWSDTLNTVYFLKDHLGSIRAAVLDSTNAPLVGFDDYDPWGYVLASRTKPIPSAYLQGGSKSKFIGMQLDDDYGLNWLHTPFRPYDGLIGRWVVVEPLAINNPGLSPYHYAGNNPIVRIDPLGLDDFYYDDKGNLVERKKHSWWHNLWNSDKYYVQGSDKAPNEFKGKEYWEIESAIPENLQGKLEGVVEDFETQLAEFVNQNAAEGMYPYNFMEVLKKSPEGAQWDLKNKPGFDERKIYIYDGKGYRNDYVGNVAWATIMANSGWPIQMSLWGGGFYQTFVAQHSQMSWWLINFMHFGDDPRDSNAIYQAYYNTYLNWIKNRTR